MDLYDQDAEIENIWARTLELERKRRLVLALEVGAAIVSGVVMVAALYYVYSSLGGWE